MYHPNPPVFPRAGIYLPEISNKNNRTMLCEICPKLTTKKPERRQSDAFIFVNLKHILYNVLVFLLLTLSLGQSSGIFPTSEFELQFIRRTG